jgi:transmembrane sensor
MEVTGHRMDDELLFRSATARTTPAEEQALAEWRAGSAANERAYREVVDVLCMAADADDTLVFGPAPAAQEMLARRRRTAARLGRGGARRSAWRAAGWLAAAGIALALALPPAHRLWQAQGGPAATAGAGFGSDEFVTELEPATVGLRDGSVVRLAPGTRLRVHTRHDGREVSLAGRGFFTVVPDPALPFTVRSDAGVVTVLGTRFDLTAAGEDLRLIVLEGSVRLTVRGTQTIVRAGQLAQVRGGNLVPPIEVPDPASLIGWVGNFISFHETPLRAVARELERLYQVRIEFSDPQLGDRTVTALFAGRSYDEIAEVICVVAHLKCTKTGDILRMAPAR